MTNFSVHLVVIVTVLSAIGRANCDEAGNVKSYPSAATGQCDKASDCDTSHVNLVRLDPVKTGHVQQLDIVSGRPLQMNTVSVKPALFEIPGFLTDAECDYLIQLAKAEGLRTSDTYQDPARDNQGMTVMDINQDKRLSVSEMRLTIENHYDIYLDDNDVIKLYDKLKLDKNKDTYLTPDELQKVSPKQMSEYLRHYTRTNPVKKSRMSQQVWLFPDQETQDETFQAIADRVQKLTKLPRVLVQKSDVQVVQYGLEGHYNAHWDSTPLSDKVACCTRISRHGCRICRFMTVLFYLNDVVDGGGTAFPVADNDTYDENYLRTNHHINLQLHCDIANLKVKPERGKAVMWYNHFLSHDGWMGELDRYSWHGGCPVTKGEKWIANFWIKTSDDKQQDLTPHDIT